MEDDHGRLDQGRAKEAPTPLQVGQGEPASEGRRAEGAVAGLRVGPQGQLHLGAPARREHLVDRHPVSRASPAQAGREHRAFDEASFGGKEEGTVGSGGADPEKGDVGSEDAPGVEETNAGVEPVAVCFEESPVDAPFDAHDVAGPSIGIGTRERAVVDPKGELAHRPRAQHPPQTHLEPVGSALQRLPQVVELAAPGGRHPQVRPQAQRARPLDLEGQVGPVLLPAVLAADADPAARDVPVAGAHPLEQEVRAEVDREVDGALEETVTLGERHRHVRPAVPAGQGTDGHPREDADLGEAQTRLAHARQGQHLAFGHRHLAPGHPIEGVGEAPDLDVTGDGKPQTVPDRKPLVAPAREVQGRGEEITRVGVLTEAKRYLKIQRRRVVTLLQELEPAPFAPGLGA